jgi:cob(I)alamin adenosyltransferase
MKIYTKTGDKGMTSLLSGERAFKNDPRIKAYGTVDELNSFVGLLASYDLKEQHKTFLQNIQNKLYHAGSLLAVRGKTKFKLTEIENSDIEGIEKEIDLMNAKLPELKHFIIPGGSHEAAVCHICRTVCRRAEREVVELAEKENTDDRIVIFLNRLSDYFFVLSRMILSDKNLPEIIVKN